MSELKTIKTVFNWRGKIYNLVYKDTDSFDDLLYGKCKQCYGFCFYKGKILIVGYKDHWSMIGGTIEKGENFEETLKREIKEESNMEVLGYLPIGYQYVVS